MYVGGLVIFSFFPIRPVLLDFYFFSFVVIEKELEKGYFGGVDMAV